MNEAKSVRQNPGEDRRRWFFDEYFDLIVWEDQQGSVSGFHLSYDKQENERLIEWRRGSSLSHFRIDEGRTKPDDFARTPTLRADSSPVPRDVLPRFREAVSDSPQDPLLTVLKVLERSPIAGEVE